MIIDILYRDLVSQSAIVDGTLHKSLERVKEA